VANNLKERCPEMMALLRHTEDSIFFKDMDGRFVFVSESKAHRSGVSWEEMLGKNEFDFLPEEQARHCRDDEISIMESGESIVDKEEELTRSDGSKSWVSVSKFPWKDINGEIIEIIGISRDKKKTKKMEKHILQMLSIATHDMRGPIVSIAATIKLLSRGSYGKISGSVKETLVDVLNRMFRLEKIVGEYLAKSSLMSSDKIGKKEVLDLRQDIIDPILSDFSQEIERKNILIDNELGSIPGNRILIKANKNWLSIVYRNLISNAVKYTPANSAIAFGFEEMGDHYKLNIYNNGPPVDPLKIEKIFEMFESENSTGLGLPIGREIMRKHGGDLWYEKSLDGHPNFIFTLPKE